MGAREKMEEMYEHGVADIIRGMLVLKGFFHGFKMIKLLCTNEWSTGWDSTSSGIVDLSR